MNSTGYHRPSARIALSSTTEARSKRRRRTIVRQLGTTCLAIVTLMVGPTAQAGLPAFPGAEGAGALAVGGRGGVVCKVTNLNDAGSGSLRECVEMEGPRTVIFEVGGTIALDNHLWIRHPYITIAGQTAPGGGIQIKSSGARPDRSLIVVSTNDVIIRYLRARRGVTGGKQHTLNVTDTAGQLVENVIVDHSSLFWAEDQNFTVFGRSATTAPRNITLQNSIIAEPVDGRVLMYIGAANSDANLNMTNIDIHSNLLANSKHRNPMFRSASGRYINNIGYHATSWWSRFGPGSHVDIISNKWKRGPENPSTRAQEELHFWEWFPDMRSVERFINRDNSLYIAGNWGQMSGMRPDSDNWSYTRIVDGNSNDSPGGVTPEKWKRDPWQPLAHVGVPITVRHVDNLEAILLPYVGAAKRLNCDGSWSSNRDEVDARVVEEYRNYGGIVSPSHEDDVGGFPLIKGGVACTDSSGDGIPDEWALANGFEPADPLLGNRMHESGYTYLELYLNGLAVKSGENSISPPASVSITVE